MLDDITWVRSYVLAESDGSIGTFCVYQATSPEAVRRHAAAAELPIDEIVKVADTVIVTADPVSATV
jgi:sporulation protein YlmC with PRC-barrel domain